MHASIQKSLGSKVFSLFNTNLKCEHFLSGSVLFDCSFESPCTDLEQESNDVFNWTRLSGPTPSGWTGPQHDHTTGNRTG